MPRAMTRSRGTLLVVLGAVVVVGLTVVWLATRGGGEKAEGSFTAVVRKGSATLAGTVPSAEVKSEIGARAAELVGGQENVTNDIVVDPNVAAGPWLEATIGAFAGLPAAPRPLRYLVADGTLTLEGVAATAAEKAALDETVRALVEGRLEIDDRVTVAGG